MRAFHDKRTDMAEGGNLGAEWLIGMHQHFGQTGEYRGSDVFRLLGDQRVSFDLTGAAQKAVVCHESPAHGVPKA